jgi:hypothetical protein
MLLGLRSLVEASVPPVIALGAPGILRQPRRLLPTMKWSLWRMIVALTIAVVLILAARYLGWSHTLITVE